MSMTTATRRTAGAGDRERRTDAEDRRLFLLATLGFAVLFLVVGLRFGQDVALQLQKTPTTTLGWRLVGWLVAAPPYVVTMVVWHERGRVDRDRLRRRLVLLAGWIGLTMLVLPARLTSAEHQFGTGALVGDPLSTGWAWGALAALLGLAFSGLVLVVLHRTVEEPTARQRDLTARFLEGAWLVLLVVSLGFALYGGRTGVFQGGT
jgi:hypothetical protein